MTLVAQSTELQDPNSVTLSSDIIITQFLVSLYKNHQDLDILNTFSTKNLLFHLRVGRIMGSWGWWCNMVELKKPRCNSTPLVELQLYIRKCFERWWLLEIPSTIKSDRNYWERSEKPEMHSYQGHYCNNGKDYRNTEFLSPPKPIHINRYWAYYHWTWHPRGTERNRRRVCTNINLEKRKVFFLKNSMIFEMRIGWGRQRPSEKLFSCSYWKLSNKEERTTIFRISHI